VRNILFFKSFLVSSVFLIFACTPNQQKSLLSDGSGCVENCSAALATEIAGDLLVDVGSVQSVWNIEQGDLFEISGICKDLGRKNNRILVEGFHVEDDQSVTPYINNTISSNCQLNLLGLTTAQQCFFVSQGNGLVDSGQMYPQCINGRFSFQVRLGNISKIGAVTKSYFFRTKIRTTDGITADSSWSEKTVKRELSAPNFSIKSDLSTVKCEIKTDGFKFKHAPYNVDNIPDITYMIKRESFGYTAAGAANNTPIVNRLGAFTPFNDLSGIAIGDAVANFGDDGRASYLVLPVLLADPPPQPGVKYNYYLQARAGVDDGILSPSVTCNMPAPEISGSLTGTNCSLTITRGKSLAFTYEWAYGTTGDWTASQSSGLALGCSLSPNTPCNFNMIALPAGRYFAAVRTADITGRYGKWSSEIPCQRP
jgi:hypothetical protein